MRYAAVIVMMVMTSGCAQPSAPTQPDMTQPSTPAASAEAATGPRVIFPDGFVVRVEIAADDHTRAEGLMWRDQLRPGTGMLFLYSEDGEYSFWMKNTKIPLDMVWIDSNYRVAAVKFHVPPCVIENCPSYSPNASSRYILEVAGGVAEAHGIKVGDQLRFEELGNVTVR